MAETIKGLNKFKNDIKAFQDNIGKRFIDLHAANVLNAVIASAKETPLSVSVVPLI